MEVSLSETPTPEQNKAHSYEVDTTVFTPITAVDTPVPGEGEAPKAPPFRLYSKKFESTSRQNRRLRKKVKELQETICELRNVSTDTSLYFLK